MHQRKALQAVLAAHRLLLHASPSMPLSVATTFLSIALYEFDDGDQEPLSQEDLSKRLRIPATTVSAHIRYLGDGIRHGRKDGLKLVETVENSDNKRKKVFFLSARGVALADQIEREVLRTVQR